MARQKSPLHFKSRRTALWVGYGGILIGAMALFDAYEGRGRQRPFATRFLPGA